MGKKLLRQNKESCPKPLKLDTQLKQKSYQEMISKLEIKRKLETQTCPIHKLKPTVELQNGNIRIETCCDSFQNKLSKDMDEIITQQIDDSINDVFKDWK